MIENSRARALLASTKLSIDHEPACDRILALRELADLSGMSKSTLERMRREGTGVPAIRLSGRRIGYRLSDYLAWLAAREPA
jgi:predicted DNA-binding transcriptional regulator AlpA